MQLTNSMIPLLRNGILHPGEVLYRLYRNLRGRCHRLPVGLTLWFHETKLSFYDPEIAQKFTLSLPPDWMGVAQHLDLHCEDIEGRSNVPLALTTIVPRKPHVAYLQYGLVRVTWDLMLFETYNSYKITVVGLYDQQKFQTLQTQPHWQLQTQSPYITGLARRLLLSTQTVEWCKEKG